MGARLAKAGAPELYLSGCRIGTVMYTVTPRGHVCWPEWNALGILAHDTDAQVAQGEEPTLGH